jgi:hypothetical protein
MRPCCCLPEQFSKSFRFNLRTARGTRIALGFIAHALGR